MLSIFIMRHSSEKENFPFSSLLAYFLGKLLKQNLGSKDPTVATQAASCSGISMAFDGAHLGAGLLQPHICQEGLQSIPFC